MARRTIEQIEQEHGAIDWAQIEDAATYWEPVEGFRVGVYMGPNAWAAVLAIAAEMRSRDDLDEDEVERMAVIARTGLNGDGIYTGPFARRQAEYAHSHDEHYLFRAREERHMAAAWERVAAEKEATTNG